MNNPVIPAPRSIKLYDTAYNGTITERIDPDASGEGYRLTVTSDSAVLSAADETGLYYGRLTVQQLRDALGFLPECEIEDKPAFEWRGFMVDCVRHFLPLDDLKRLLEAAAYFKINKFHWHLTDDQGWRIEIKRYPKLCEIGSVRPTSDFGKFPEQGEHGGFYTQDEAREIIEFCRERHIEVIPEIELPGHTSALLSVYPELSCSGDVKIKTRGGVFSDILCVGNENAFPMVCNILDEIVELFPSKRIHIGGDEAPKDEWERCPKCQKLCHELGFDDVERLQGWFTRRVTDYLRDKGVTASVWSDALASGVQHESVTVQYWLGDDSMALKHVEQGGTLVASPFFHYYMDYPFGMTPLKKTHAYSLPFKLSNEAKSRILGVEAPIWAEHIRDAKKMGWLSFPRLAVVAETGWTGLDKPNYDDFERRFDALTPHLAELGISPANKDERNPRGFKKLKSLVGFWWNSATKENIKAMFIQNKRARRIKRQKRRAAKKTK